jgi:DNA-binding LacI/PurR family transcriptional regulator
MTQGTKPSAHEVRRIAVEACCDPETVHRYFEGRAMKSTTTERVEAALRRLGMNTEPARQAGAKDRGDQPPEAA